MHRREIERSAETRPATICNTITITTPGIPSLLPLTNANEGHFSAQIDRHSKPVRFSSQRTSARDLGSTVRSRATHRFGHARESTPQVFSPLLFHPSVFSARPPSHQGGVSCEAPRRYRTPHGVLCVRMFVTFGGGKEVVAALAAELQRRVSPCNGLQ